MNPHEKSDLLFDVQRSIRYHDRRVAHFDKLHKATNVLTILISGVVILDVFSSFTPTSPDAVGQLSTSSLVLGVKIFAAIAALFGAFDLVVGFGHRANEHRDLNNWRALFAHYPLRAPAPILMPFTMITSPGVTRGDNARLQSRLPAATS